MESLYNDIIGSSSNRPAKILTIVADNFSFLSDQSRYLKATYNLAHDNASKHLIQFGPLHTEIRQQLDKKKWNIVEYGYPYENICDKIDTDIDKNASSGSIMYINDISRFHLGLREQDERAKHTKNILRLIDKWKRLKNISVVVLYQNSLDGNSSKLLRDLIFLSDAFIRAKSFKDHYFQEVWYQPGPMQNVKTAYYNCKIVVSYWDSEVICFSDLKQTIKDYDPNQSDIRVVAEAADKGDSDQLRLPTLDDDDDLLNNKQDTNSTTLPYLRAQNPEQSRIFYYPDKDDDIDEDDPDNDLNI